MALLRSYGSDVRDLQAILQRKPAGKTKVGEFIKIQMSLPTKSDMQLEDMLINYTDKSVTFSIEKANLVRAEMLRRGVTPKI